MASVNSQRAIRATIRKVFPNQSPDVSELDFAALAAWHKECTLQRLVASTWTLDGFRWRRAASSASHEYSTRLVSHTSTTPGLCDHCQVRAVTAHVAYQPMDAPRIAHYCERCAPSMPVGWLVVWTGGKSRSDSTRP